MGPRFKAWAYARIGAQSYLVDFFVWRDGDAVAIEPLYSVTHGEEGHGQVRSTELNDVWATHESLLADAREALLEVEAERAAERAAARGAA